MPDRILKHSVQFQLLEILPQYSLVVYKFCAGSADIFPLCIIQVKQQHLERNIAFLADELKVVPHHEAEDHVFFVSAREALTSRVNQDRGTPTPSEQMHEGYQGRLFEFANFERKFEVIGHTMNIIESVFIRETGLPMFKLLLSSALIDKLIVKGLEKTHCKVHIHA